MTHLLKRVWDEDEGVLSFEWILLVTLLVIGIVGGVAASRDAIIDEMGDISEATLSADQSWELLGGTFTSGLISVTIDDASFTDDGYDYVDCDRASLIGQ